MIRIKVQLLITDYPNPKIAFFYDFEPKKNIYVWLRPEAKGSVFEPQTKSGRFSNKTASGYSLANNVKKNDIKLIRTRNIRTQ